ncbi:YggT family protein [Gordonia sp. HY285]|uniref:YggT family protein n=1 Tax=Gordonia liuliyuniae TaxID=2911517 RepID=UPI001F203202|nr:YggT family protein [Gordonia liuliyuniae]MCF8611243.1 YggT family protein [Gordonia liuliyuniae]
MAAIRWVLYFVLFVYTMLLLARLVLETVQSFARRWRPKGPSVIAIEVVFTSTDPPVKFLRRVVPPLNLGAVRLDLSLLIVLIVVSIGMEITQHFAYASVT